MAPSIDEFEDLTQFADESFDTDEVDLFEFTDDEDSPLLRLKSIVLSLDWDITEETLAELNEELRNLRSLWEGDKVAQIYLQGMENVGRYLQDKGAYAHPNAIKLLLTLYYNYEKIISSTDISGEAITAMLKADIRKFKVLQYQISTYQDIQDDSVAAEVASEEISEPEEILEESVSEELENPLKGMEATILGLEWEVTDEGLEKFHSEATALRENLRDNREAQVLIQGLQALGAYIREQKTQAHPDSFTILHSFYDALKLVIENKNLSAEQRRQILIEQITSLNSLKEIISRTSAEQEHSTPEPQVASKRVVQKEPELAEVEEEEPDEEFLLSENELATGTEEPIAEELDFNAFVDDDAIEESSLSSFDTGTDEDIFMDDTETENSSSESAEDEDFDFDEDLFSASTEEDGFTPALADAEEESGFQGEFTSKDRALELDQKLDFFFNFDDEDSSKTEAHPEPELPIDTNKKASIPSAVNDTEKEGEEPEELDSFFNFDDDVEEKEAEGEKSNIFVGLDKAGETGDEEEADSFFESEEELDSFFNFDDAEDMPEEQQEEAVNLQLDIKEEIEAIATLSSEEDEEPETATAQVEKEDDEGFDSFFSFNDEDEVSPQVAAEEIELEAVEEDDFGDIASFSSEALAVEEPETATAEVEEEADDGFDSFFGFDHEDEVSPQAAAEEIELEAVEEDDFGDIASFSSEALAVEEPETATAEVEKEDDEGFDSFFSFDDADEVSPQVAAEEIELEAVEEDDFGDIASFSSEALAVEEPETTTAEVEKEDDEGFDSFFSFDDADEVSPQVAAEEIELEAVEEDDIASFSSEALTTEEPETAQIEKEDDEGFDSFFSFDDEDEVSPQVAAEEIELEAVEEDDFGDIASFSSEALAVEEPETTTAQGEEEADDGLDSFFSFDDADEFSPQVAAEEIELEAVEEDDFGDIASFSSEALAVEEPETATAQGEEEADDGLDSFFGFDHEDEFSPQVAAEEIKLEAVEEDDFGDIASFSSEALTTEEPETATAQIEADDGLDSFFGFDNADEVSPQVAAEEIELEAVEEDDFGDIASFSSEALDDDAAVEEPETAQAAIPSVASLGLDSKGIADIQSKLDTLFHFDDDFTDDAQVRAFSEDSSDVFGAEEELNIEDKEEKEALDDEEALDSFFALDAEESEPKEELPSEEAEDFFEDNGFADEETEVQEAQEEEALDSFFALDAEEGQVAFVESGEEQPSEETENFFTEDISSFADAAAEDVQTETRSVEETLKGLSQAAAAFAAAPSTEALAQVQALTAAARQEKNLPVNQAIVVQLLDSSANLLAKAPEHAASNQAIIRDLAAGFEQEAALVDLIAQYTAWQQNFFAEIINKQQAPSAPKNTPEIQEVHEEFSRLRNFLMEEFQQLKKELHEVK
jgi:pilus assembly protein FimV